MRRDANGADRATCVQMEPLLLTRPEAAAVLGIGVRKLDQWCAAGLIQKWKLDGVVRFAVDDLRAFVANQKQAAGEGRRPRTSTHPRRNGVGVSSS
jgi:hypothetical protein